MWFMWKPDLEGSTSTLVLVQTPGSAAKNVAVNPSCRKADLCFRGGRRAAGSRELVPSFQSYIGIARYWIEGCFQLTSQPHKENPRLPVLANVGFRHTKSNTGTAPMLSTSVTSGKRYISKHNFNITYINLNMKKNSPAST